MRKLICVCVFAVYVSTCTSVQYWFLLVEYVKHIWKVLLLCLTKKLLYVCHHFCEVIVVEALPYTRAAFYKSCTTVLIEEWRLQAGRGKKKKQLNSKTYPKPLSGMSFMFLMLQSGIKAELSEISCQWTLWISRLYYQGITWIASCSQFGRFSNNLVSVYLGPHGTLSADAGCVM